MGDARYERSYDALSRSRDQGAAIFALSDEQIIEALTAAALRDDARLANVLATEATNRIRRVRAALVNLGEGVLALGLDGTIHWMNPAAEKILRISWKDAVKKRFDEVVEHLDEDGEPVVDSIIARAGRGAPHAGDGERLRIEGGDEICVSYTSAPILGPHQEPEGVVLSFQDCSKRKAAEREIRESRERYKTLFDRIDVGIVSVATDGTVLDINAASERITARPFSESRGRPWSDFLHPDDLARVMELFGAALRGEEVEARVRLLHREGRYVDVHAKAIPIVVDGQVIGLHGVLRPDPPSDARH